MVAKLHFNSEVRTTKANDINLSNESQQEFGVILLTLLNYLLREDFILN